MIRHSTIKAVIHQRIGNVDPFSEDLVKMPTQFMGDGLWIHCPRKAFPHQFRLHVLHVVVKVTTHHDTCIDILSIDVIDDFSDSPRSFLLERLLSRFEVAIEYLHLSVASCQTHPAKVGAECFYQGQFYLVGGSCPTSTVALQHCLVGPVIIQVEWILQLGLIQADEVNLILTNELTDRPLFLFPIEASYVEAYHSDFLQHFSLLVIFPSPVKIFVRRSSFTSFLLPPSLLVRR